MKKLIPYARKQRQFKFKIKLLRNYVFSIMITIGMKQGLAQEVNFAAPVLDPFHIYHNIYFDSINGEYRNQMYEQFIDMDNDEDLDLLFFDLNLPDGYLNYKSTFYYQRNTINENGKFDDTIKVALDDFSKSKILRYDEHTLVDFDKDGDLDLYGKGTSLGYASYDHLVAYENNSNLIDKIELAEISPDLDENIGGCDGTYSGCSTSFSIGDLDNDENEDIVSFYQLEIDSSYGSDTALFIFFKNRGALELNPFNDRIYNPFNLESVASKFTGDSLLVSQFHLHDLNGDGFNDLTLAYATTQIPTTKWVLETFFADHLTGSFDRNNSQIIDISPRGSSNFSINNNYLFADVDSDGDVDIYKHSKISEYYSSGSLYINNTYDTLYFIENLSPTTDIVNQEKLMYQLFPNPITNQALLTFSNGRHQKATFELFNAYGQLVQVATTIEEQIVVDAKEQSPGFYTFRVTIGNEYTSGKLIID